MEEVFKVRFIKTLFEIFTLSLWGFLRSSFEPCCNLLIGENMKGMKFLGLILSLGIITSMLKSNVSFAAPLDPVIFKEDISIEVQVR